MGWNNQPVTLRSLFTTMDDPFHRSPPLRSFPPHCGWCKQKRLWHLEPFPPRWTGSGVVSAAPASSPTSGPWPHHGEKGTTSTLERFGNGEQWLRTGKLYSQDPELRQEVELIFFFWILLSEPGSLCKIYTVCGWKFYENVTWLYWKVN